MKKILLVAVFLFIIGAEVGQSCVVVAKTIEKDNIDIGSSTSDVENSKNDDVNIKEIYVPYYRDANQNAGEEYRNSSLSSLVSTGLIVRKGQTVQIEVGKEITNFKAKIGYHGSYKSLNDGNKINFENFDLVTGINHVSRDDFDGILYLENKNIDEVDITVKIIGGESIPHYELGKTTHEEWTQQLVLYKDAPVFELESDYVSLVTTMEKVKLLENQSIESRLRYFDEIYLYNNLFSGLSLETTGVAKKWDEKLMIIGQDSNTSNPYAGSGHINMMNGIDSLLNGPMNQMNEILFHEIGHVYQNSGLIFTPGYSMYSEITNELSRFFVTEKFGIDVIEWSYPDRTWVIDLFRDYIHQENSEKNIDDFEDNWENKVILMGFFWQLQMAFGDIFYSRVHQEYRMLNKEERPNSMEEKK